MSLLFLEPICTAESAIKIKSLDVISRIVEYVYYPKSDLYIKNQNGIDYVFVKKVRGPLCVASETDNPILLHNLRLIRERKMGEIAEKAIKRRVKIQKAIEGESKNRIKETRIRNAVSEFMQLAQHTFPNARCVVPITQVNIHIGDKHFWTEIVQTKHGVNYFAKIDHPLIEASELAKHFHKKHHFGRVAKCENNIHPGKKTADRYVIGGSHTTAKQLLEMIDDISKYNSIM